MLWRPTRWHRWHLRCVLTGKPEVWRLGPSLRTGSVLERHRTAHSDAPCQVRARLRVLPELSEQGLWGVQVRAIRALEKSFAKADPRVLIQMAPGRPLPQSTLPIAFSSSAEPSEGRLWQRI